MDGQKPEENQSSPAQFAPGDTIRPQQPSPQTSVELPSPTSSIPVGNQPVQQTPVSVPDVQPSAQEQQLASQAFVPESGTDIAPPRPPQASEPSFFSGGGGQASEPSSSFGADTVSWTASEYISHSKNSGWYALVLLGACVGAVLVWLITKDILSAVVVVFAGALFATYAARQPRELSYQLDPSGLTIGQRHYSYNEFRSFSVVPEGAFSSIVFSPLKRFGMLTTVYYDPQDEDRILNVVSQRLPHEERRPDVIESVMHRMRF